MKIKYIRNMKPELMSEEGINPLLNLFTAIEETFEGYGVNDEFERGLRDSEITLKYGGREFKLSRSLGHFTIFYIPENIDEEGLSTIKRILKFNRIMREVVKLNKIDNFATAVRETIININYYFDLYNLRYHNDTSEEEKKMLDVIIQREFRTKRNLMNAIEEPSENYEIPSRFIFVRSGGTTGLLPFTNLIKSSYVNYFLLETKPLPFHDILPLHELLKVSDDDSASLRRDIYDFREVLKRVVARDRNATLCFRNKAMTYEYTILTGEEKITTTPNRIRYTKISTLGEAQFLYDLERTNCLFGEEPLISLIDYFYSTKDYVNFLLFHFNFDVDVNNRQPRPEFSGGISDMMARLGDLVL